MKTIVEALQDLYVAMGGESADVSDLSLNPDVIEQIAQLVQSGETKELPAVTADDNDKVLAVVNGAWDKAEASGGGDTETEEVFIPQSVGSDYGLFIYKYGNVVHVVAFSGTITYSQLNSLHIPDGYRPSKSISVPFVNAAGTHYRFQINQLTGEISVPSGSAPEGSVSGFNATYVIKPESVSEDFS